MTLRAIGNVILSRCLASAVLPAPQPQEYGAPLPGPLPANAATVPPPCHCCASGQAHVCVPVATVLAWIERHEATHREGTR